MKENAQLPNQNQEWQDLKGKPEQAPRKAFTDEAVHPDHGNAIGEGETTSPIARRDEGFSREKPGRLRYAGFWLRFLALIIDSLIFLLAGIILAFLVEVMGGSPKGLDIPFLLASWLYYAIMESSSKQGTIGKIVLGISVTDLEGNRISFARATGRYSAKMISSLLLSIGYIVAAFTSRKQALHDIIASTLVVRT